MRSVGVSGAFSLSPSCRSCGTALLRAVSNAEMLFKQSRRQLWAFVRLFERPHPSQCSWLAVHVSLAFPLVAGILFIPAVANLLLASFTDPGILHRGAEGRAGLVIQALRVKERRFDLHWCQKCQYYCPPRTFHCPWCNVCVEEFDHHCKWLNNCIGCRNFRFFFLFVAFLCGYNVVVLASCITYLVLNSHQAYGAEKICAIMVTIPAALYLLPLLILVGSQASFITLAKRTYELKLREESRANPFDLGWARNWYAALCAPQGPKYMVRAAEPKAATRRGRKAPVARLLPQMSRLNTAPPGLSSHRCPQNLPGQRRAAQAGAKGTWWPASPERKTNVAMTGTADGGGGAHWKSQIHSSNRAVSPTAALLSVSDL
ncbi:palmitoyltransferase ZDHHC19 isoform X1 [Malaclemys terrapin pileata]|uniref:palmitoyltransferase ZDHHC19 isoform X1 n=2 Tax=Malaclemys terrapin pileata TaxID=2991368 RepID=UPI0023A8B290|nr:palmitoyltransferase ZDHHC19 isoform X1 [Malaclemys terrapin pileata]